MDAMAHLVNAAAQLVRQRTKNGILLGEQWGGEVCSLLHTLEQTEARIYSHVIGHATEKQNV